MIALSNPFPQNSGSYAEEEAERLSETKQMDATKETVYSRHNKTGTHMNSHRQRQPAQACQSSVPNVVLELRGEVDTWAHP